MAAKRAKMPEEEKRHRKLTNKTRAPEAAEDDNCTQICNIPAYICMHCECVQWVCRLHASANAPKILLNAYNCLHESLIAQHPVLMHVCMCNNTHYYTNN